MSLPDHGRVVRGEGEGYRNARQNNVPSGLRLPADETPEHLEALLVLLSQLFFHPEIPPWASDNTGKTSLY